MLKRTKNQFSVFFDFYFLNYCEKFIENWGDDVRIITGSSYLEHSDPLFSILRILKIMDIYKFYCCIHARKNLEKYITLETMHNTRNANNLITEYQRLNVTQRSVKYIVPKLYNDLPVFIKISPNLINFKRNLRDYLLNSYTES